MFTATIQTIGITLMAMAVIVTIGAAFAWIYFLGADSRWRREPESFAPWAPGATPNAVPATDASDARRGSPDPGLPVDRQLAARQR